MIKNFNVDLTKLKIVMDSHLSRRVKLKKSDNGKSNIDNLKNENLASNKIDNKKIEKYIDKFLSLENSTRELIVNLVEKIYIYQNKTIDIIFSFNNKMI